MLFSPKSWSVVNTCKTLVPVGSFSNTLPLKSADVNTGANSFISIISTMTSTTPVRGVVPMSMASTTSVYVACSSRSTVEIKKISPVVSLR